MDSSVVGSRSLALLRTASALVVDVDGVLTDGTLLITDEGKELRTLHVRDGLAMEWAVRQGFPVWVVSGGRSQGVPERMARLGIQEVHMEVADKAAHITRMAQEHRMDLSTLAYLGDDLADWEAMKLCGIPCCPADAISQIRRLCVYVSPYGGGKGCVRDVLEKILRLQGRWPTD